MVVRTLTRARLWLLLVLISSCSYQPKYITLTHERKENEEQAIRIIWQHYADYAGERYDTRNIPIVEWINQPSFPCAFGTCYGIFYPDLHLIIVAWPKYAKFSRVSLAHELCHAYFRAGHDTCNNDLPPVESANAELRVLGM